MQPMCTETWHKHKTREVTNDRSNREYHLLANHARQGTLLKVDRKHSSVMQDSGVTPMGSGWANPRAPELRGHPQGAPSL